MQPKNKAERRKAFINFLLLFLLCTGIILTTAFFSMKVPFKHNDQLRKEMEEVEKEREFSRKFTDQLISISNELDSISTNPPDAELRNEKVKDRINKLDLMISDSISNKDLYIRSTHNLKDMGIFLKHLREKESKDIDVNSYIQQVKEAQDKAQLWFQKYQDLYKEYMERINRK